MPLKGTAKKRIHKVDASISPKYLDRRVAGLIQRSSVDRRLCHSMQLMDLSGSPG